jgi:hypothetical protein
VHFLTSEMFIQVLGGLRNSAPDPTAVYVRASGLNTNSGAAWLMGQDRQRAPEFLDHNVEPRNVSVTDYEWTVFAETVSRILSAW